MNEAPIKIRRVRGYLLECHWSDGFSAIVKLSDFRRECPCAECRKNDLSKKPEKPAITGMLPLLPTINKGMNELKSLKKVGNYALAAEWGDGHSTGIYTWDNLRDIFENYKLSEEEVSKFPS